MESLISLLESIKDLVPQNIEQEFQFSKMLYKLENDPENADARLILLLKEIKKYPELSIFDNLMQVMGSGAIRIDLSFLISWLIKRTSSESAVVAVQNLKKYLASDYIPLLKVIAVSGLELDKTCDIGDGIQLTPWNLFPDSPQKAYIEDQFSDTPYHLPHAALIKEKLTKRSHIHVPSGNTDRYIDTNIFSDLDGALLCTGLVGPVSSYSIAQWLQPPTWAPLRGSAYSMPLVEGRSKFQRWPTDGCDQIRKIYKAFLNLNDDARSAIKIPLQRLNKAMRKWSLVDAAIDLGIALESIFLNDIGGDRGELTFRLKLRASKYLGYNLNTRKKLFKIFGNLYTLRSKAVHSGKLPQKLNKEPVSEILTQGFTLTAKAITQIIFDGLPDWTKISLL